MVRSEMERSGQEPDGYISIDDAIGSDTLMAWAKLGTVIVQIGEPTTGWVERNGSAALISPDDAVRESDERMGPLVCRGEAIGYFTGRNILPSTLEQLPVDPSTVRDVVDAIDVLDVAHAGPTGLWESVQDAIDRLLIETGADPDADDDRDWVLIAIYTGLAVAVVEHDLRHWQRPN